MNHINKNVLHYVTSLHQFDFHDSRFCQYHMFDVHARIYVANKKE